MCERGVHFCVKPEWSASHAHFGTFGICSKLGVVLDSSTWLTRAHAYTTTGDLAAAVACIASAIDSATSSEVQTLLHHNHCLGAIKSISYTAEHYIPI